MREDDRGSPLSDNKLNDCLERGWMESGSGWNHSVSQADDLMRLEELSFLSKPGALSNRPPTAEQVALLKESNEALTRTVQGLVGIVNKYEAARALREKRLARLRAFTSGVEEERILTPEEVGEDFFAGSFASREFDNDDDE